jgi:hypothetical protein
MLHMYRKPNTTISIFTHVETNTANVVDICNTCHRIPVRSPENRTTYFVLLIARVHILFTVWRVQCVASNSLASLSSPSTNAWMDTLVTLQTSNFFVCASTSDSLTTVSKILTMKILVIKQNCLWNDFQRQNRERFWIKELRVLHPDDINRKQ